MSLQHSHGALLRLYKQPKLAGEGGSWGGGVGFGVDSTAQLPQAVEGTPIMQLL